MQVVYVADNLSHILCESSERTAIEELISLSKLASAVLKVFVMLLGFMLASLIICLEKHMTKFCK